MVEESSTKTTAEAFKYFVEKVYPNLANIEGKLKVMVHRYRKGSNIPTERKMIEVLTKYNFKPVKFEEVPVEWEVKS